MWTSQIRPEAGFLEILRAAGLIAVLVGAAGSLALMFHAGRRNPSWLLIVIFALWVLSPFVGIVLATVVSKRWAMVTRTTLYCLMLILAIASVALYGVVALGPPRPQAAFIFVVVPPASWLLMAIAISLAELASRRRL